MENRLETLRFEIDRLIFEKQSEKEKIRFFIEHLYSVARYCSLLALKRNLNQEIAMTSGMLHDIANVNGTGGENHALKGAEEAENFLRVMNLYTDEEIKTITAAISRHSDKNVIHEPYDELLKDGDVMSHCFYNPDIPVSNWERERYTNLLIEFGITHAE